MGLKIIRKIKYRLKYKIRFLQLYLQLSHGAINCKGLGLCFNVIIKIILYNKPVSCRSLQL